MPMMVAYLTKLPRRRHTVSPRAPSTLESRFSSFCTMVTAVSATQTNMRHAVSANTFRPRSQPPPRM